MIEIAILLAVMAVLLYYVALGAMKRRPNKNRIVWFYRGLPRFLPLPDISTSQYYNLRPNDSSYLYAPEYPTRDDVMLKSLAESFKQKYHKKTTRFKAGCLLAMVQQNIKYVSDLDQYSLRELWVLPWETLMRRNGDCEDSAFLYAGLAYMVGIPVVLVDQVGHMTAAVGCEKGLFTKHVYAVNLDIGVSKYYYAESTSFLPWIGFMLTNHAVQRVLHVKEPSEDFKAHMIPIDRVDLPEAERSIYEDEYS